jgi:hypothetical protein
MRTSAERIAELEHLCAPHPDHEAAQLAAQAVTYHQHIAHLGIQS